MTGSDLNNLLTISHHEPGYGSGYGYAPGDGSGFCTTPEHINTGHAPEKASLT